MNTTSERAERSFDRVPLRHPDGRRIVSESTVLRARAIAEALFSRGGAPPDAARLDWLALEIEDYLARSGARIRRILWALIWLVSRLAPLLVGRFAPLAALSVPERVEALVRLEERFGEPLLAVKAMLCLLYYEHEDAAREVGFDGACLVPATRLLRGPEAAR